MKNEIKIWGLLSNDFYIKDAPPHQAEITLSLEEFEKLIREKLDKIGIKFSQCKKCGKDILFLETKTGKQMPITCGLISHFADCPNAKDFRK